MLMEYSHIIRIIHLILAQYEVVVQRTVGLQILENKKWWVFANRGIPNRNMGHPPEI